MLPLLTAPEAPQCSVLTLLLPLFSGPPCKGMRISCCPASLSLQENENILISASGDGSIKVWDLAAPPQANPLRSFEEHTHEVGWSVLCLLCCACCAVNL